MYDFRWIEWNVEHIARHGVMPAEAEWVVNHARSPWPAAEGDGKFIVWGPTSTGRLLQVCFVTDTDSTLFVIHAMELPDPKKKQYRRRLR